MTDNNKELGYSSGALETGGKATCDSVSLLKPPRDHYEQYAKQTPDCFTLLPAGSDLRKDYVDFYALSLDWVDALMHNLGNAGVTLVRTTRSYCEVDPPAK